MGASDVRAEVGRSASTTTAAVAPTVTLPWVSGADGSRSRRSRNRSLLAPPAAIQGAPLAVRTQPEFSHASPPPSGATIAAAGALPLVYVQARVCWASRRLPSEASA